MTDHERALLVFEESHPRHDRTTEVAIRTSFGISRVRYRQILARLTVRADVIAEFPVVAHRVQRATADAVRRRAEHRFA